MDLILGFQISAVILILKFCLKPYIFVLASSIGSHTLLGRLLIIVGILLLGMKYLR